MRKALFVAALVMALALSGPVSGLCGQNSALDETADAQEQFADALKAYSGTGL